LIKPDETTACCFWFLISMISATTPFSEILTKSPIFNVGVVVGEHVGSLLRDYFSPIARHVAASAHVSLL